MFKRKPKRPKPPSPLALVVAEMKANLDTALKLAEGVNLRAAVLKEVLNGVEAKEPEGLCAEASVEKPKASPLASPPLRVTLAVDPQKFRSKYYGPGG